MIQEVVIKGTIDFTPCSAELQPSSFPLLEEIRRVLQQRPNLCLRVEGHTDSAYMWGGNGPLSEARASAVVQYLQQKAEAGEVPQLTPAGFGDSKPVGDNRTSDGKRKNRRVPPLPNARCSPYPAPRQVVAQVVSVCAACPALPGFDSWEGSISCTTMKP